MSDKKDLTILDYVKTCFSSFNELPFNEIDAAIFCQLSYLSFHEEFANNFSDEGMPLTDLLRAEYFEEMVKTVIDNGETLQILFYVVSNPRYRGCRIKYYRNEFDIEKSLQFSAVVFCPREDINVVTFRGTDKTFTGWKEDVLLVMTQAAPGQMMAVNYLNGVAKRLSGNLYVCGHSKGGNLALYSSAHCKEEVRERICHIYNLDGPGLLKNECRLPGFLSIKERLSTICPIESPIGMILRNDVDPTIIRSNVHGVMQHAAYTWIYEGTSFTVVKERSNAMKQFAKNISAWAETASDEEPALVAEIVFGLFEENNLVSFDDFSSSKMVISLLKTLKNVDSAKRKKMTRSLLTALRGAEAETAHRDEESSEEFDLDWNKIDIIMNELETERFGRENDLFL